MDETNENEVSRRSALLKLGGLAAGAIGAGLGARELLDGRRQRRLEPAPQPSPPGS